MSIDSLKEGYPTLKFQEKDGKPVCIVDNFSYGVLLSDGSANVRALKSLERMQLFLDTEDEMINRGKKGDFAIILPDLSIKIYPTEGGALNFAQKFGGEAFVCQVGKKSEGLPCDLLGLSGDEWIQ
jgi:hypothetical protein